MIAFIHILNRRLLPILTTSLQDIFNGPSRLLYHRSVALPRSTHTSYTLYTLSRHWESCEVPLQLYFRKGEWAWWSCNLHGWKMDSGYHMYISRPPRGLRPLVYRRWLSTYSLAPTVQIPTSEKRWLPTPSGAGSESLRDMTIRITDTSHDIPDVRRCNFRP
jgi:hypothetical protein